ncbi:segregation and condensation protein b [Heliomicrobium modesticaldum Ice1]|uniref:Segregation and condensation protein B n=1 Tax=Heliobacterium modesticaldum (strain ATCC 51547 / Ice1) TaxID=498761 RepID=B0TFC7_HELMI|nr:SMC-Scp complex subunit ScpB [Heliomicrobium modesticaldum]ABZ84444.1 segregation and condensation protein b [Heliomicrobium modesticaldum Ice1]
MIAIFPNSKSRVIEALLFVSSDPLSVETIAEATGFAAEEVRELLAGLKAEYDDQERGWQLEEVAGGFRLSTRAEFAPYIERLLRTPQPGLSNAALETLAIIAYHQPVTRAEIEQIRGVKADRSLATLLGKGLIQEVGRKEALGRPILYGTTDSFLRHFGLRSLADLPKLEEVFLQEELPLTGRDEHHNPEG